jgi:mannose/fructose/N-acetylgalactosamine-specific phosphotransferase system component IIC
MMAWIGVALWGGMVGLDSTSFPQAMISRPLVAGGVTGLLFGRPIEGVVVGFLVEAFSLITLPIGAARYPEPGTATVAAAAAFIAATPAGLQPGYLALALAFALGWERLSALTVVLQRRANGRMLVRASAVAAGKLERRHLAAMSADFLRGSVVCTAGSAVGFGLFSILGPYWGLAAAWTTAVLAVVVAAMVGTAIPLFGGLGARRMAVAGGVMAGILAALVLR